MKNLIVYILLSITLIFAAFVGGIYVGRNHAGTEVIIEFPATESTTSNTVFTSPSLTTAPLPSETAPVFPININTATVEQLQLLPDIGPSRAEAIVRYRDEFGPFTCIEEIMEVKGIGDKIFAKIRDLICIGG